MAKVDTTIQALRKSVIDGDEATMTKAINRLVSAKMEPDAILMEGLVPAMDEIGRMFDEGKIYLPQIVISSHVFEKAMDLLSLEDAFSKRKSKGTVVMGTVMGDIHEIGKNICISMLRGAGYKVIDLGSDVSPEKFAEAAQRNSADIVSASAMMTTTLPIQGRVVTLMRKEQDKVLLIFGGAPCNSKWVDDIGGDGYSSSGYEIVQLVNRLMEEHTADARQ
ncbi:MAG: cobalamin-dependent protein [Candidatus Methanomethylophilaceae archaeon]|nr:cobalamin-dependent protein [Candidatus Methanomethylophilaceae archaeon]